MCAHNLSRDQGQEIVLKTATTGYHLEHEQTLLVRSDYFQVNWTVKSRRGKALDLLRVGINIHNIRVVQTSGIVHEHTLEGTNGSIQLSSLWLMEKALPVPDYIKMSVTKNIYVIKPRRTVWIKMGTPPVLS